MKLRARPESALCVISVKSSALSRTSIAEAQNEIFRKVGIKVGGEPCPENKDTDSQSLCSLISGFRLILFPDLISEFKCDSIRIFIRIDLRSDLVRIGENGTSVN